LRYSLL